MFQDNSPQEIYGYCHLCYELKKFGVDYTHDLGNWKRHVGSQCHPATEKPSDCDICGEKFRSMRDHDRHYCTKVPKTTEGWTTYKLLEKESVAARTISKLNPSLRQEFCFEQKLCIPGVYPGLGADSNANRDATFAGPAAGTAHASRCGSVHSGRGHPGPEHPGSEHPGPEHSGQGHFAA